MATFTKKYHHAAYDAISPHNEANSQAGRTVLIAGSTSGIGFAIATGFIQAKASRVILVARRPEELRKASQKLQAIAKTSEVLTFACDLSIESSIRNLWQRLLLEDITVDVLILNAADSGSGPIVPFTSFLTKLRVAMEFNLFCNVFSASQFLEQIKGKPSTGPKAIINISSFMAHSNPSPMQAAYATSKAAFAHTLQLLADDLPASECQIINMHPGAILTEAVSNAPQEMIDSVLWDSAELPAAFAVWASTQQASFLHGHFVWSSWDVNELKARKSEFEDAGYLKLGLQGAEYVDIRNIFDKIRRIE